MKVIDKLPAWWYNLKNGQRRLRYCKFSETTVFSCFQRIASQTLFYGFLGKRNIFGFIKQIITAELLIFLLNKVGNLWGN